MPTKNNKMDKEYWNKYYKTHKNPGTPSPFAIYIQKYISENNTLLELGCGNGRDAVYLANNGLSVIGMDQISEEIDFLNSKYSNENLKFICDDFTNIKLINNTFNNIYSRFTLHAISEKQANDVLQWTLNHLENDGLFLLEVRSTNDELYNEGEKIIGERNVRITSHYRRFIEFDILKTKITNLGFHIVEAIEDKNLAVYKDENPVVIRIIAQKR